MADTAVGSVPAGGTHPDGDFDGDAKSDVTVFRPSTAQWFILKSGARLRDLLGVHLGRQHATSRWLATTTATARPTSRSTGRRRASGSF